MFFAKLHPLIVHFPVGLLVSGALFEIYGKVGKEEVVRTAGRFNVRLGFWCALPVMGVGFLGMLSLKDTEKFETFLGNHILSVFSTLIFFLLALLISRFAKGRFQGVYYFFLGMGLLSVLATGYFGGELVHRFGVSTREFTN
ncbi:MAG: hypothetical protein NPINA01_16560 [Nitrospinaceae bacterium]|nr:MAG: hypothetical protein NPINA01_16560 [Nitrospinaceae bacterium]